MGLKGYLAKRVLQIIPLIFAVMIINFTLIHLAPGDIAYYYVGHEGASTFELEEVRQRFGLDQPIWTQFAIYMQGILRLDLGTSWTYGASVISVIAERIPATLLLSVSSFAFSLVIGVVLGALSARKQGGKLDLATSFTFLTLNSAPIFWGGLMLILLFSVNLHWFPTSSMVGTDNNSMFEYILDVLWHLFLPCLTLTIFGNLGAYLRITRSSVIEVVKEDFITTAKAIGYPSRTVFIKHALRNSLLPVFTFAGYNMGYLFSGALITESVFNWPGIGRLTFDAIGARDYPLIMGCYLIASICVIFASLITDLAYTVIDPRVKVK